MLKVNHINTYYGSSQALYGASLEVKKGEVVTLLGRNGMGKTTMVKSIMGLMRVSSGSIIFNGKPIHHRPSYIIARMGIGLVPEGRQIFPNLTVYENIIATAANRLGKENPYSLESTLSIFPRLADRMNHYGNQLSGGEQQMLAVVRALMTNPNLLILDEATEGLAPLVRKEIWHGLTIIKNHGQSILIIDKNLDELMKIADRYYVMDKGRVVWTGDTAQIATNDQLRVCYLGV